MSGVVQIGASFSDLVGDGVREFLGVPLPSCRWLASPDSHLVFSFSFSMLWISLFL